MYNKEYLAIVLAAGKGSRLNTKKPKALYKIMGKPMINHILDTLSSFKEITPLVVVGHKKEKLISHLNGLVEHVEQLEQNGTGDAVICCLDYIKCYKNIFIFMADSPFIGKGLILDMINEHKKGTYDCSFLYSRFPFDLPYGRLIFNNDKFNYLVESNNANDIEIKSKDLFTSQYLITSKQLLRYISKINADKKTREYNLTDIINIFTDKKLNVKPIFVKEFWKLMGINTKEDVSRVSKYVR